MANYYVDTMAGIDYTGVAAWASGSDYSLNVLATLAGESAYAGKRVYKCIQSSGSGSNAPVAEGNTWWSVVADGSLAKPYLTIIDGSRGAAANTDELRIKKTTPAEASASITFWDTSTTNAAAYRGRAVSDSDLTSEISAGDFVGNYTLGFWLVYAIDYNLTIAGKTAITLGLDATSDFLAYNGELSVASTTTYIIRIGTHTSAAYTASQEIRQAGPSKLTRKNIKFGWDFSTDTQTGYTFMAMGAVDVTFNKNYLDVSRCQALRGRFMAAGGYNLVITGCGIHYETNSVYITGTSTAIDDLLCTKMSGTATIPTSALLKNSRLIGAGLSPGSNAVFENNYHNVAGGFVALLMNNGTCIVKDSKFYNMQASIGAVFYENNSSGNQGYAILAKNCYSAGQGASGGFSGYGYLEVVIEDYNQTVGDNRHYRKAGAIFSDATVRHTASGVSWRHEPRVNANAVYPLYLTDVCNKSPFQVGVSSGQVVTATIWVKKSSTDTGLEAVWTCQGGQSAGPVSDVSATATDSTDWQQLSVTFTATATGVVELTLQVWGSSTATVHCDDFGASAA